MKCSEEKSTPPAASDLRERADRLLIAYKTGLISKYQINNVLVAEFAAIRGEAKAEGWDDAVKALRSAKPEQRPKPTIAELEEILSAPAPAVHINPDGSIGVGASQFEKAADWLASNRPAEG